MRYALTVQLSRPISFFSLSSAIEAQSLSLHHEQSDLCYHAQYHDSKVSLTMGRSYCHTYVYWVDIGYSWVTPLAPTNVNINSRRRRRT